MANKPFRPSSVLIKEAELLAGPNHFIYTFYTEISKKVEIRDRCWEVVIDVETEDKLLSKNDRFVDLTLAQFCLTGDSIRRIFTRAISEDDLALKLACLSNINFHKRTDSHRLPLVLFDDDSDLLLNWFRSISENEIDVLFKNKTLDDDWLSSLLQCNNDLWNILDDGKRVRIIETLSQNPRVSTAYEGITIDGYGEYLYNNLFSSIWDLTKKVPVSHRWARALNLLLDKTVDRRYDFDSIEVAKRWTPTNDKLIDGRNKEFLDDFESVRFQLYKNIIKDAGDSINSNPNYFDNADVALRACAYSKLKNISNDEIFSAVGKDGSLAIDYLLLNTNLWQVSEKRELLKDLCFEADEKSPTADPYCINNYLHQEEMMSKLHPSWFTEKLYEQSNSDDNKPLTPEMAREFIREFQDDLFNSRVLRLNSRFEKIDRIFYTVLATLIILLIK